MKMINWKQRTLKTLSLALGLLAVGAPALEAEIEAAGGFGAAGRGLGHGQISSR